MTKRELNRDIERLRKYIVNSRDKKDGANESYIAKEFNRLYKADKEFTYLNKKSILTLLEINLRYRIIPLFWFGMYSKNLD